MPGEVCARDGHCRDQCAADRDCISGQVCASAACADPEAVQPDGTLAIAATDAGAGTACHLSSDCGNTGLVCRQGYCGLQCKADIDCVPPEGPGGHCVDNRCITASGGEAGASGGEGGTTSSGGTSGDDLPAGYGKGCNLPSDCDAPLKCSNAGQCVFECNAGTDCAALGACCVAHQCTTGSSCEAVGSGGAGSGGGSGGTCRACVSNSACDDGLFCNGQEQCYAGCCAPALDTPCNSHSACIVDTCTEKTKKCSSKIVAAEDVDGDGHLAFGCAGGDDCDDADPTVYTGHSETFDGKDNDCNTYVDDWSAQPKGVTSSPLVVDGAVAVAGVPIGGGAGAWLAGALLQGANWKVAALDKKWTASPYVTSVLSFATNDFMVQGATSGPDTACFLEYGNLQEKAIVVDAAGVMLHEVLLGPSSRGQNSGGNVVWTGSNYLAGWQTGNSTGFYALVDTGGNLIGTHSVPGAAALDGHQVSVAANGTSLAVAWDHSVASASMVTLAILNLAGGVGGTLDISSAKDGSAFLDAVAGTPGGYVVLWSHDNATYATSVSALNGQAGAPKTFVVDPEHVPNYAKGATDGVGAAFLIQYPSGASFGYLHGSLKNPFELATIAPGASIVDIAGGVGGRLGLFYTQTASLYGRQAGFAGLTGDACVSGSNCASGKCKAIVPSGPKAHSACE